MKKEDTKKITQQTTAEQPSYALTDRVKNLRVNALNWQETQAAYIGQRLYGALKGLASTGSDTPWMQRKSRMLCGVIDHSAAIIQADELIAGYNYYGSDDAMWNEVSLYPRMEKGRAKLAEHLRRGILTPEQIDFSLNMLDKSGKYTVHMPYVAPPAQEYEDACTEGAVWSPGVAENHTVLGYEKVLKLGFSGILAEAEECLENLDLNDGASVKKKLLLACVCEVARSACGLGERYKRQAEEQLKTCMDYVRAQELKNMIEVLGSVPKNPARNFYEAVQSLWFAHIINTWEDGINANSIGRIDQILYPYYKKDLDDGRITREEAFELLCCLWIKLYRDYDVQQAMIGGVDKNGQDAANELSFMLLDVTDTLDFVRCLSVRLHSGSPPALIKRALEIVGKGNGIPFFFNDDVMIPALVSNGVALEDARDYAAIGCVEITIPGKANPHAVSNRINLLKCLELALNDGRSIANGDQVGPHTGDPGGMKTIRDVAAAYEKQAAYFTKIACFESNRLELQNSLTAPMVYKSMLTEGCLDSGRDFNDGGAMYNYHESMPMGIPNVADSLAALEKLVFKENKYTLPQVVQMMKDDFPDEYVRQEFLNRAPKFGNDDDAADRFAADVLAHFCRTLKEIKGVSGLGFFAQPFTFLWLIESGMMTAATPDGRRQGENIAYSISPMQGRDGSGLTAVLNSIAKLPANLAAGSTSAIIEVDPVLFEPDKIDHMVVLIRTAIQKGVGQLQFNVTSAETLKKAQAEPEKYQNLAVRVSGFSQKFCLLDKNLQDHIIARTKHTGY